MIGEGEVVNAPQVQTINFRKLKIFSKSCTQPPKRFELLTLGLQDLCPNH